jgi:spermidine synthase
VDEVLIIGLAGGTIARQLLESWPMAHIDGVEIDGEVVAVGREYFDNDDDRISPFVMDGRIFLQATDRKYDIILVDAYRQPYIPFHLTTTEFWQEVDEHLTEDGVVAINVASVKGVDDGLLQMIYATMKQTFPTITKVEVTSSNDILFAVRTEKDPYTMADNLPKMPRATGLDQLRPVLRRKTSASVPGWRDAKVLTDDKAPVEMAWDLQALEFI